MLCPESMKLEGVYRERYDQARFLENGGSLIFLAGPAPSLTAATLDDTPSTHTMSVRRQRATQAQAANAILMHQRTCTVCGHDRRLAESLAS